MKSSIDNINNISEIDHQLVHIAIDLVNSIIWHPEEFEDKKLTRIYNIAQEWNKVFNDFYCSKEGAKS